MYRRHVLARSRLLTRHARRFVLHNVLHADDPPDRLARGVAVGMFAAILPTFGFQSAMVLLLAWVMRANKIVGLPLVWISNPFTFVPIYYPSYVIGALLTGYPIVHLESFRELAHPPDGWWEAVRFYWERTQQIAIPFVLGSTLVGLILGLLSYFITFHTVRGYRLRRWGKLVPPAKIRPVRVESDAA